MERTRQKMVSVINHMQLPNNIASDDPPLLDWRHFIADRHTGGNELPLEVYNLAE